MSIERKLLERWLDDTIFEPEELDSLMEETRELLAQPEQNEYIKMKKEQEIYFVKDEFGTLRPTFKNPKETPFWIDVLHMALEVRND